MNGSTVEHTKLLHINESCIIIVYIFKMRALCAKLSLEIYNQSCFPLILQCKLWLEIFHHLFAQMHLLFFHDQILLNTFLLLLLSQWETETKVPIRDLPLHWFVNAGKKIVAHETPVNITEQFQSIYKSSVMTDSLCNIHSQMIIHAQNVIMFVQSCCFLWIWLWTKV